MELLVVCLVFLYFFGFIVCVCIGGGSRKSSWRESTPSKQKSKTRNTSVITITRQNTDNPDSEVMRQYSRSVWWVNIKHLVGVLPLLHFYFGCSQSICPEILWMWANMQTILSSDVRLWAYTGDLENSIESINADIEQLTQDMADLAVSALLAELRS